MDNAASPDLTALDHPESSSPRYVIGLKIESGPQQARAVLLKSRQDAGASEIVVSIGDSIPTSIARGLGECRIDATTTRQRSVLSANLTDLATDLVNRVLAQCVADAPEVLAVGLDGFGVWGDETEARSYQSLLLTALLAEATGLNVVDDFPSRDLAQGGLGGPVEAHGWGWLLLRTGTPTGQRSIAIVDLGQTLRVAVIRPPLMRPRDSSAGNSTLLAFDIGPGTQLLNELTGRLTGGVQSQDVGGKLAVQGRGIPDLLDLWLSNPVYANSTWRPAGVSAMPFVYESLDRAVANNWSLRDMLCTATHLLAESVARAFKNRPLPLQNLALVVLTGEGRRNGLLLSEVKRRLQGVPICPIEELGFDSSDLPAASVAGLTFLHIDQIPAYPTRGAQVARVLGRLTPGNPASWHRLLRDMSTRAPQSMLLRDAV